jgi:hypothetical protein
MIYLQVIEHKNGKNGFDFNQRLTQVAYVLIELAKPTISFGLVKDQLF